MKIHLLTLCLICKIISGQTLIPYSQNGWWGYCDSDKKIMIPSQYQSAESFKNGYARVTTYNREFIINTKGDTITGGINIYNSDWIKYGRIISGEKDKIHSSIVTLKTRKKIGKPHKIFTERIFDSITSVSDDELNYYLINISNQKILQHPDWRKVKINSGGSDYTFYKYLWENMPDKFHLANAEKGPLYKNKTIINKDSFTSVCRDYSSFNKIICLKPQKTSYGDGSFYYLLDTTGNYINSIPYSDFVRLSNTVFCVKDTSYTTFLFNLKDNLVIDKIEGMRNLNNNILTCYVEGSNDTCEYTYVDIKTGQKIFSKKLKYGELSPMINNKAFISIDTATFLIEGNGKCSAVPHFYFDSYNIYRNNSMGDQLRGDIITPSLFRFFFIIDTSIASSYPIIDFNKNWKGNIKRNNMYNQTVRFGPNDEQIPLLAYNNVLPAIESQFIPRSKDTVVILKCNYFPEDKNGKIIFQVEDRYGNGNLDPIDKTGYWVINLDGDIIFSVTDNTLMFEKSSVKTINDAGDLYYDKEMNLFKTNKGYFNVECDLFYFD